MRFQILGPIRVEVSGREVPITAGRDRILLATLLLHANQPVAVDRLVDAIWPASPPQNARNQLQGCVSRLRKRLGGAGITGEVILTEPAGYRAVVEPHDLDLLRFRRLVAEARAAAGEGRYDDARADYRAALALWRGPALADIADAAAGLDEERVQAREECLGCELAAGAGSELVVELTDLVREYPHREGLHRALMLALYRAGRQADALAAYRHARRLLREELGIEPGSDLQRLHQEILNRDPALDAVSLRAPSPVPRQLPSDVAGFTGRADALKALDELLGRRSGAVVISAIAGTAGVGKTALAVHWAHRLAERFPDGQLYVNLRGFDPGGTPMEPATAVRGFLDALQVPPERVPISVEAQVSLYRSLLSDRRTLVVLDNARDADQVRPLLPGAPGCLVLVTSRHRLSGLVATDGAVPLPIDLLPAEEARQLLAARLGGERLAAEPDAVAELVAACAGLPLALAIVAARAAARPGFPLSVVAEEVRAAGAGLEPWAGPDAATDLRAVFSWSYRALEPAAARLFRLLGLHPGPDLAVPAAASLAGLPLPETRRLLTALAEANLLIEHVPGRFTLHDLLRAYATELTETLDSDADRHAARNRVLDWYLRTTEAAADILYPEMLRLPADGASAVGSSPSLLAGPTHARSWLETERVNLLSAIAHASDHGPRPVAWQLAHALRGFWWLGSYLSDGLVAATIALAAARREADLVGQSSAQLSLGTIGHHQGRQREALEHYEAAAGLARQASWAGGRAIALSNGAITLSLQGHLDRAVAQFTEALALWRGQEHRGPVANVLSNLGVVYHELGRLMQAAQCFTESLALFREIDAPGSACAIPMQNLACVARDLGHLQDAHDHAIEALVLCRKYGNRTGEASALNTLATVQREAGQSADALASAQAAVRLTAEIGARIAEAAARNTLGTAHRQLGRPKEALKDHQQALEIARQASDPSPECGALLGLAAARRDLGDLDHARTLATQVLDLARRGSYRLNEGRALTLLAEICFNQHEYEEASRYAGYALDNHRETGYRHGEARARIVLGHVGQHAGDSEGARREWRRAHALFVDICAPESTQTAVLLAKAGQL